MDLNIVHGGKLFPQGSILGPHFFRIFLCDLVLEHEYYCLTNYTGNTTPYVVQKKKKTSNPKTNNTIEVV